MFGVRLCNVANLTVSRKPFGHVLELSLNYRFMNHTKTSGGARLLRANLLQPLTSLATIRMRQEAVQEFIGNDDLSVNVTQALSILPKDLDK